MDGKALPSIFSSLSKNLAKGEVFWYNKAGGVENGAMEKRQANRGNDSRPRGPTPEGSPSAKNRESHGLRVDLSAVRALLL